MVCPNCKTDLVNINGRYICSGCGKEVPEAEVNVGGWGESGLSNGKVIPVPGSINAASVGSTVENEDYLEGETTSKAEEEVASEEFKETEKVVLTASTEEPSEKKQEGFYTIEDMTTPKDDVDLQKIQETLTPPPSKDEVVDQTKETPAAPVESISVEVTKEPDSVVIPIKVETLPGGGDPIPQDPEIYRDPISEDLRNEDLSTPKKKQDVASGRSITADSRTTIILVSVGLVLAIALLGGGIFAFITLTSKANPDIAGSGDIVDVIDCDSKGDEKTACIADSFSTCKLASWSSPYGENTEPEKRTLGYTTRSVVNGKCEIDLKMTEDTVNIDNVGKSMVCTFDHTTTDVATLQDISENNCTGNLSTLLFGDIVVPSDNTSNVDENTE